MSESYWIQLHTAVSSEHLDEVEALLDGWGATSVSVQPHAACTEELLEPRPGEQPLWPRLALTALFTPDTDMDHLQRLLQWRWRELHAQAIECSTSHLNDQDWVSAWRQQVKPICFAERLWICPTDSPPGPAGATVFLDAGLAFGTGSHPTTALCLGYLAKCPPRGANVMDYGCGSGILGIAALKLGARSVWSVDYDPQACTATQANAEMNGVAHALTVFPPDALPVRAHDLVLANILARVLIELAPVLLSQLRVGGSLVLSGILGRQAREVTAAFPTVQFTREDGDDEWVCLIGKRVS